MRIHCIFIACLALFALCTLALDPNPQDPGKCCFFYSNMRIPVKQVDSYQTTFSGCTKEGIIFFMKSGIEICVNPNDRWVQRLKKLVDARALKDIEVSSGDSN
ncbi:C-C motif chemokine 14-like [Paramisgurnus dabryanus]|uniref:C-C motif chemokine 14-like n=1 Tax=Paramisgurnus dabryanus TaxID=90735 RepID=UPI0031F3D1BF